MNYLKAIPIVAMACFSIACTSIAMDGDGNPYPQTLQTTAAVIDKAQQCPERRVVPKLRRLYERTPDCGGDNQPICHPLKQQSQCDRGFHVQAPDCNRCVPDTRIKHKKGVAEK